MQCKCCMSDITDGKAACGICGFPLLASSGVDMERVAGIYRKKLLDGYNIALKVYYYDSDDNGSLAEKKSEYLPVSDALSLVYREVKWVDNEFNPPDIERDIELSVQVVSPKNTIETTVGVKIEKGVKCARLGLYLEEGLSVRFAVGMQEKYVLSDAFSLI